MGSVDTSSIDLGLFEVLSVVLDAIDLLQFSSSEKRAARRFGCERHSFAQPIGGHGAVRPRPVRPYSLKGDAQGWDRMPLGTER